MRFLTVITSLAVLSGAVSAQSDPNLLLQDGDSYFSNAEAYCKKITDLGNSFIEGVATESKSPTSSIRLLRLDFSHIGTCTAVVDTANGPKRCEVRSIVYNNKNKDRYTASALMVDASTKYVWDGGVRCFDR